MIRLERVSKSYGSLRALSSVSVDVRLGESLRLLGPNGSGKSTLLGLVGTLIRPSSGRVDFGALGGNARDVRRSLGWLGHGAQSYPALSGRELLELHLRLHGHVPSESNGLAERFELGAFWERPMGTYSRGQAQRVALARAVSHGPRVLLLDEPTTGLDVRGVAVLQAELVRLHADGVTLVMVTHDRSFGLALGWRDITLERGRLLASAA